MDITEDIRPLTEFKRDTARFVARLKDTGRPAVLTVNGRPELVVMDAQAWQDVSPAYGGAPWTNRRSLT